MTLGAAALSDGAGDNGAAQLGAGGLRQRAGQISATATSSIGAFGQAIRLAPAPLSNSRPFEVSNSCPFEVI